MVPNRTHNAWTLEPPAGCRFFNQVGGEVTLFFPRGQEQAVHDWIVRQLAERLAGGVTKPLSEPVTKRDLPSPARAAVIDHVTAYPASLVVAPAGYYGTTGPAIVPESDVTSSVCTERVQVSPTHDVQCTESAQHKGMHAVLYQGVRYPLKLAPEPAWTKLPDPRGDVIPKPPPIDEALLDRAMAMHAQCAEPETATVLWTCTCGKVYPPDVQRCPICKETASSVAAIDPITP